MHKSFHTSIAMSKPSHHDSLFMATFSKKKEVAALIKTFFPQLAALLDFRTLKLETDTYVNENLDKFFSDMVYLCQMKGASEKIKITLLPEHKSFVPKVIFLQLLKYMIGIYDLQLQNENDLSLVVPIVVYHGNKTWHKRSFTEHFGHPQDSYLARFVPNFDYELIDLNAIAHEQLLSVSIGFYARASFTVMKAQDKEELAQQFTHEALIFVDKEADPEIKLDFISKLLTFIFRAFSISQKEVDVLTKNANIMEEAVVGNLYDKLIEEGMEKGMEKGKKEARLIDELLAPIKLMTDSEARSIPPELLARVYSRPLKSTYLIDYQ